jgi:hypothetical protein
VPCSFVIGSFCPDLRGLSKIFRLGVILCNKWRGWENSKSFGQNKAESIFGKPLESNTRSSFRQFV